MNTGNVIGLDLRGSMLSGTLHPNTTLFSLPYLQTLDLSCNDFRGSYISSHFGHLLNLKYLRLNCSNLVGQIPQQISQLSKLVSLDLSINSLTLEPTTFGKIVQNLTRLKYLHLSGVNMSSVEPSSFMNLSSSLTSLDLSSCDLRGTFPNDMPSRSNLQYLSLENNIALTGKFPSSNESNSLSFLSLYNTKFSIHLEPYLFNVLASVQRLYLGGEYSTFIGSSSNIVLFGNLTLLSTFWLLDTNLGGEIPSSFGNLNQLMSLSLSGNHFTGQIPKNFGNLTQLYMLDLSNNNFSGQIPENLANLTQLITLDLSDNNFAGRILENLANLIQLAMFDLSNNNFIGQIPKSLGNLIILDLRNNRLQGPIPTSLFKLVNLTFLALSSNNKLVGELPSSICNLKSLEILDLSNNGLKGVIPHCLGNFSMNLIVLHLGTNQFEGSVPPIFLEGNSLQHLNFNGNKLTGKIPASISNCANLEILDLGNNLLEDTFPYALQYLPQLQALILRSNKIHGVLKSTSIASTNKSFAKLQILDISNNNLGGSFPADYFLNFRAMMSVDKKMGYMGGSNDYSYFYSVEMIWKGSGLLFVKIHTSVTMIDLSGNKISGQIPESIGKLASLKQLNLSHNFLKGPIQPSLQNLTNLEALDLSSNSLAGRIPPQLVELTFLSLLNLSHNQLEGPVPMGKQFNTFSNESYDGNSGLCGLPLSKSCDSSEMQPPPSPNSEEAGNDSVLGDGFTWQSVVMGYGCGVVVGLVIGYIVFKTGKPAWLVRMVDGGIMRPKAKKSKKNARRRVY